MKATEKPRIPFPAMVKAADSWNPRYIEGPSIKSPKKAAMKANYVR